MENNKSSQSAFDATLNRTNVSAFDIDPSVIEQAAAYSKQQQETEKKTNPVLRRPERDRIVRANNKEREEFESRRDSIAYAEKQWKELFS